LGVKQWRKGAEKALAWVMKGRDSRREEVFIFSFPPQKMTVYGASANPSSYC